MEGSSVEHSVILENSCIYGVERLEDSLIGKNTEVTHSDKGFNVTTLFIGDDARAKL